MLARLGMIVIASAALSVVGLRLYTVHRYSDRIVAPAQIPAGATVVVFGAGVYANGEPTTVLYDRVATAAELFLLGTVDRIILSGDGRPEALDEPEVMRRTALRLGVPDVVLIKDGDGLRTQETCRQAARIGAGTPVVLVSQHFHLTRALMLCEALGVDARAVAADRSAYAWRWRLSWHIRETAATAIAWWETVTHIGIRRLPER